MKNKNGGFVPENRKALGAYRSVDLITMPSGMIGTNCGNCMWFRKNFCENPSVLVPVNNQMCCNLWDAPGTIRY